MVAALAASSVKHSPDCGLSNYRCFPIKLKNNSKAMQIHCLASWNTPVSFLMPDMVHASDRCKNGSVQRQRRGDYAYNGDFRSSSLDWEEILGAR